MTDGFGCQITSKPLFGLQSNGVRSPVNFKDACVLPLQISVSLITSSSLL
jgi:hypothetical protein